jgi:hypothetical protein
MSWSELNKPITVLHSTLRDSQDNMRVRFLDWRASLSLLQRVERVERVAGAVIGSAGEGSGGTERESEEGASTTGETGEIEGESATDAGPPPVGDDDTYCVIIGSDIMYEVCTRRC